MYTNSKAELNPMMLSKTNSTNEDKITTETCYVVANEDEEDFDISDFGVKADFFEDDDESVKSLSDTTNCEIFGLDDVYIDRRSHSFTAFSYGYPLNTEFSDLLEDNENEFILKTDFQLTKEGFLKKLLDMDFVRNYDDEKELNLQLFLCRELVMESNRNEETLRSDLLFLQNENRRIEMVLKQQLVNQSVESQMVEKKLRKELSDLQVETERLCGTLNILQQDSRQVEDALRKELLELREENERLTMQSQQFHQCQSELLQKLAKCEEGAQQHIEKIKSSITAPILEEPNNSKYKSMENALSLLSQELEDMRRKYHQLSTLRTAEQITLNFIVNQNEVFPSDGNNANGNQSEKEASYPAGLIDSLLSQIQLGLEELCLPFNASLGAPTIFPPEASSHSRNYGSVQVNRNFYPKLKSLLVVVQHQIKSLSMEKRTNRNIPQCKFERNLTCLQHGLIEAGRAIRQLSLLLVSNGKNDRHHELRRSLVESLEAIEALIN